ncbi:demethylmenaquinone methyltransferase/2-methoxy-6-polyprenyl-1,4-benzoquinol methylase [Chryseobacterium bernardetii]|jgi:demethylmenaquinone methyltransferase/2-methoxy-6-polyprenyl-1,4-benzoquinol methylase|uniref:Demethylmenaquinone methyltransferase/2-methoxy-6-polyprenyl-1,4-benzoquinol methylase n=2 Tax=Chryseobacterium TaxID=59732 RepID=A0A543ELC5_9FLAO|nr:MULTISPECIES: class I SAM-dependent methyltransferase [Chryseobacterium]MDR6368782.1 demethylmenaquinone methyltransferase/2-methoxy-6-polyprenyl-1,4-benzoquinol methylase [Chryseobacterium vietnamense]MDR6440295.1 demethylmenaquinone methyltransferase/2-methoxy-6-polyprenyl-1,4-benzoquinol methylase [Chryseobacterium bernardetii]MDR6489039.1 demethylmenaquinone methyltransferase/2-methoxy-6-polyprenyl-1,4-benzoquinol methylase [Chryseobacterium vietnamense]TQM22394.1 demethylmenaquinone met
MNDLQQYFDHLQPRYYINEIASLGFTRLFRKMAVQKVKNYGNKRVLDLMSGQGENLEFIKAHNENTEIVALDFSSAMHRKLAATFKNKLSIQQIQTDFFESQIPDHSMDIILCSYGTKTIEEDQKPIFADRLSNIIDEKGEIIIVEFVKPKTKWRFSCVKWYIEVLVTKIFGNEFGKLFHYINKNKSLEDLKVQFLKNELSIISHKRYLDLIEILHVKRN